MKLPQFRYYGPGSDYNGRAVAFEVGGLGVWFSYSTVVAFSVGGWNTVVSENCWGPTTGKHLNAIDGGDKKGRLPRPEFEQQLSAALQKLGLEEK